MDSLKAFFSENIKADEEFEYVASKKFIDENGNPIKWKLKTVPAERDEEIRKNCTKRVVVNAKRGQYTNDFNANKYMGVLTAECIVFPNLLDAGLQNSYGVMTPDDLLRKMLAAGEYANLVDEVQKINGFDIGQDELVDEVKN